jgi:tyrosyl-tRNA synthetase
MFGKLMSISDELMARYYPLLLGKALDSAAHPLEAKKHLAAAIVETYHSQAAAEKTLKDWSARFSEKRLADSDLPEFEGHIGDTIAIVKAAFFQAFTIFKSGSEARRLIEQGSVQLDGVKLMDPKAALELKTGQVLRLDKTHAVRIK